VKATTLKVGSRQIAVEQSLLPGRGVHLKFDLSQPTVNQLRLRPGMAVRVVGWIGCVLGFPPLLLGLVGLVNQLVKLAQNRVETGDLVTLALVLVWGGLFSFFGLKLLGPRYRFDSSTGELTTWYLGRSSRRSLAEVVAVQVIRTWIKAQNTDSSEGGFVSYQLNLVLDDPGEQRLFIAYNPDLEDMETKAKLLAEFLNVPLLTAVQAAAATPKDHESAAAPPTGEHADPTRNWPASDKPMPPFDVETWALGDLRLGDELEKAQFLGRPDGVNHIGDRWMDLDYASRGFKLVFEYGRFQELNCNISLPSDETLTPGQGFCRPRLSGGFELTPETSAAHVQQRFGPPTREDNYPRDLALTYHRDGFEMEFEFERATGKLLAWSAMDLNE
jgi:hypothetical protein